MTAILERLPASSQPVNRDKKVANLGRVGQRSKMLDLGSRKRASIVRDSMAQPEIPKPAYGRNPEFFEISGSSVPPEKGALVPEEEISWTPKRLISKREFYRSVAEKHIISLLSKCKAATPIGHDHYGAEPCCCGLARSIADRFAIRMTFACHLDVQSRVLGRQH